MTLNLRSNRAIAHVLLLGIVFVWGATFSLVKDALHDASPFVFNLLRMALAFITLLAFNHRQFRHLSRAGALSGLLAGIFLGAGYQLQTVGLVYTSPTNSAFITGLVVVFVPLLSTHPRLRSQAQQGLRWQTLAGSVIAFTGLAFLTSSPHASSLSAPASLNRGDLLTLLCALAFAGHLLTLSRVAGTLSTGSLATMQVGCAALLMLVTLPLDPHPYLHLTTRLIVVLLVTPLLATAAAFTVQSWAQLHLPATHTAALLTLEPVFALLTAVFLFHTHVSLQALAGCALILLGIGFIEFLSGQSPLPPAPSL